MNRINKSSSYLRVTGKIASWTMISRILGFARDLLFASFFGASATFDAFLVAYKIPNYMRRFFSEGALTQAFIPIYTQILKSDPKRAKVIATQTAVLLGSFLTILTIFVVLQPTWFIKLFAWGLVHDQERFNLACQMVQWTFPFLLFIALTTLFSGVMNAQDIFGLPAFLPTLLNITLITAILMPISSISPGIKVSMAVTLAGILQFLIALFRAYPYLGYSRNWDFHSLKKIFFGMTIILGGAIFSQINSVFDTIFASFLPRGSISWLYYSDRLCHLPIGVITVSISTLLLPKLSSAITNKDSSMIQKQITWGIQIILAGIIPCVTMLALFGKQIVICLFYHGSFSTNDVLMTYRALMALTLGLPAFMFIKLLYTLFYAHKSIKKPTYVSCMGAIISISLNCLLVPIYKHVGIALTNSISCWIQCSVLLYLAMQNHWIKINKALMLKWVYSFVLTFLMLFIIKSIAPSSTWWLEHASLQRFELLLLISTLFLISYFMQIKWIGLGKELKL